MNDWKMEKRGNLVETGKGQATLIKYSSEKALVKFIGSGKVEWVDKTTISKYDKQ